MYDNHVKLSEIRYSLPKLSNEGTKFVPTGFWTPKVDSENISYLTLFKPFNLSYFLSPRLPIDLGLVDEIPDLGMNVLRMPLKFPKTAYKIPRELDSLFNFISKVSNYEKFINKQHNDCFCHITYDKSLVKANTYHRFPGFHGDGIQGTRLTPKINVEHSYILTTDPGTEFCLQPFFLKHLDESKHNYFMEFDKQAKEENVYRTLPNHLYLIDPYMVHRTPKIIRDVERLFIRITYAFSELQHPKNTVNPMFKGQKYEKRIDIRGNLTKFEFKVPYNLYGLEKD